MKRDLLFWEGRSGISGDMAVAALGEPPTGRRQPNTGYTLN